MKKANRTMRQELHNVIRAYNRYLETGIRCKRSAPNVDDVDCVEISGEDAVEQLQVLRYHLRVVVERAYNEPDLSPTADLLATVLPFKLLQRDGELNFGIPHTPDGKSKELRPIAEYVRAAVLEVLEKALARLSLIGPASETESKAQRRGNNGPRGLKPLLPRPIDDASQTPLARAIAEATEVGTLTVVDPKRQGLAKAIRADAGRLLESSDATGSDLPELNEAVNELAPYENLGGPGKHRLGDSAEKGQTRSFTVAAVREMTGLGNTALNSHAKAAGVKTPQRGQRNHRYSAADVRAILSHIIEQTSENTLCARCRAALKNLKEIAE